MPKRCTEAATYRRIRNSCLPSLGTRAGKPDTLDRTSGLPLALLRSSRSQKSPRPEYASEPPCGLSSVPASAGFSDRKETSPLFPVNSHSRLGVGRMPAYARPDRSADISARSNPSRLAISENLPRCASLGTRARLPRMPIAGLKAGRRADGAFAWPRSRIEAATPLPPRHSVGIADAADNRAGVDRSPAPMPFRNQ
jgi:hypothetical protein